MKKLLLIPAILIIASGLSCKKKSTFAELLIECEKGIQPSAQTAQWAGRKSLWAEDVKNSVADIGALKRLMIECETNINFSAQKDAWQTRRNGWLESVKNADSIAQIRDLLMELESSLQFTAQTEEWGNVRSDWIRRLQDLR
jgi:hypothetical protein